MTSIVSYRKAFDQHTTYRLATPDGAECTELCEIDGVTYVSVPDGTELPYQPEQIAASVAVVVPDATLRARIKAASPHCQLIKDRGHQRLIEAGYSIEDQTKLDRLLSVEGSGRVTLSAGQVAALDAYTAVSLAADAWASEQYAALGL